MKARLVLPAVCLSLALSGAIAQTTEPSQANPPAGQPKAGDSKDVPRPAAREMSPEQKAYSEAGKITDPQKKIEALEKFRAGFPESPLRQSADRAILTTLVAKFPEQTDRIRKQAGSLYRGASRGQKGRVANDIADELLSGGVLLNVAERYAKKGVDSMRLATYMADQVAAAQRRKRKAPSGEEMFKTFRENRATRVATLGRIYLKMGQTARGQRLLEESWTDNANQPAVGAALGELAAKAGNDAQALDYLVPAKLSGRSSASADAALESVYRKMHDGSLDGLDAMLDGEYNRRFPNPLHLEDYQPTEKRSDRVVLAEVFTGSGCPPCVAADLAFDASMERYTRKEVAVVMYHEHVPRPDPMTNPDTIARSKSYKVTGVPTYAIDGKKTVGGGGRDNTREVYDRFHGDVEKDLETPAEAHLTVGASVSGNMVSARVTVDGVEGQSKNLKLQIALVEKKLRYTGENGVRFHSMVVRAMGGAKGEGFAVQPGQRAMFSEKFDLDEISAAIKAHLDDYEAEGHRGESFQFREKKYQIDAHNLALVVFVQDDETRHVLQAGYVDLGTDSDHIPTDSR